MGWWHFSVSEYSCPAHGRTWVFLINSTRDAVHMLLGCCSIGALRQSIAWVAESPQVTCNCCGIHRTGLIFCTMLVYWLYYPYLCQHRAGSFGGTGEHRMGGVRFHLRVAYSFSYKAGILQRGTSILKHCCMHSGLGTSYLTNLQLSVKHEWPPFKPHCVLDDGWRGLSRGGG
jgi:hypothetical protein